MLTKLLCVLTSHQNRQGANRSRLAARSKVRRLSDDGHPRGRPRAFDQPGGHDWAKDFPLIVGAALKLRQQHFVIDGEAVVLGPDGVSNFDALRKHNERAQLYAFDMLAGDGDDHRCLTLALRKANLARVLSRRVKGIFIADYEHGDIGPDLFRAACNMGLEGIVSKRRDRAYVAGQCRHWVKVKNPAHPAYSRVRDAIIASRQQAIAVDQ